MLWSDIPIVHLSAISLKELLGGSPETIGLGNVNTILQTIIDWGTGLSGTVALIYLVYGGIQYMTSAGNSQQAGSAKNTITWAIIGLVIIMSAWAIVQYFNRLVVMSDATPAAETSKVASPEPSQSLASCPITYPTNPTSWLIKSLLPVAYADATPRTLGNPAVAARARSLIGHDSLILDKNNGCAAFTSAALGPLTSKAFSEKNFAPSHWESSQGTKFTNKSALVPGDEVFYTNDVSGVGIADFNGDGGASFRTGDHVPVHVGIYIGNYSGPDGKGGTVNLTDAVVNNSGASGANGRIIVQSLAGVGQARGDYFMGGKHYPNAR